MVMDNQYRTHLRELSQGGDGMITQYEALRHGYAYVDLSKVTLEPEAIETISATTARQLNVIPVKKDGLNLWVCMEMPPAPKTIEKLAVETGCRIIPVAVISKALEISVEHYYPVQTHL